MENKEERGEEHEKIQKNVSGLDEALFDTTINEKPVKLFQLKNSKGMEVAVTNFGG